MKEVSISDVLSQEVTKHERNRLLDPSQLRRMAWVFSKLRGGSLTSLKAKNKSGLKPCSESDGEPCKTCCPPESQMDTDYVRNTKSKKRHRKTCQYAKGSSKLEPCSESDGEPCKTCCPPESQIDTVYVLDTQSGIRHKATCQHARNKNENNHTNKNSKVDSGTSPYSKAFTSLWEKNTPKHFSDNARIKDLGKGKLDYEDAWRLVVSYCYATGDCENWKYDIPAIATHWLNREGAEKFAYVDRKHASRWSVLLQKVAASDHFPEIIYDSDRFPLRRPRKTTFRFIDLFAGVGGFRLALNEVGGECVFSSEWDQHARDTYYQNYGYWPFGDITNFTGDHSRKQLQHDIPPHDILAAGFPCQAFSMAGRKLGFQDARGTLFFDVLKIAQVCKPKVIFLENVKGLKSHDKGKTFAVIRHSLERLGYTVYDEVLSAKDFGVPQNRQRIIIVAIKDGRLFHWPKPNVRKTQLGDVLVEPTSEKYTISNALWAGHRKRKEQHLKKGNGYGFSLFKRSSPYVNTISRRYYKDGSEALVEQPGKNPRMLTERECANLQGFPNEFVLHPSKIANYKQFGNSVAVPVISAVAKQIIEAIDVKPRLTCWSSESQKDAICILHKKSKIRHKATCQHVKNTINFEPCRQSDGKPCKTCWSVVAA